jgi:inorganic pyrophosphatase
VVPTCVDVVIEIPKGSRNKYEYDLERDVVRLDRRLLTPLGFPGDYGFVPRTRSPDGDPLDVLVLVVEPTFPGCWISARPLGLLQLVDEHGVDPKIIAVPDGDPHWASVADIGDLGASGRQELRNFFASYKEPEIGKHAIVGDFEGVDAALAAINEASARYADGPAARPRLHQAPRRR